MMMKSWCEHDCFRVNCFVKKNYIWRTLNAPWCWTALESIVSSERLCSSYYWFQISSRCTARSKLDHSFVTMKWRRDVDMTIQISCSINWIAFTESVNATKRLSASWYCMTISINCIVRKIVYRQKNCLCNVIDIQIRFRCTIWSFCQCDVLIREF